jgi:hypothetical protein
MMVRRQLTEDIWHTLSRVIREEDMSEINVRTRSFRLSGEDLPLNPIQSVNARQKSRDISKDNITVMPRISLQMHGYTDCIMRNIAKKEL